MWQLLADDEIAKSRKFVESAKYRAEKREPIFVLQA